MLRNSLFHHGLLALVSLLSALLFISLSFISHEQLLGTAFIAFVSLELVVLLSPGSDTAQ